MGACLLDDDTNFTPLHDGGALADDQLMLVDGIVPVTGILNEDAEEQAANLYGVELINQRWLETNSESWALASLNMSLDFLNLCIKDNFLVHLFTPWASSLPTSSLSRSFYFYFEYQSNMFKFFFFSRAIIF